VSTLDLDRWAVVAHKDDTGFGRMAMDMRSVLGIGCHLVIPSERLSDHPLQAENEVVLDPRASVERVAELLVGLQGIVFFERHNWHPELLATARRLGVRSVCIPMWEWFAGNAPQWQLCDFFICPNKFALDIVRSYGWKNSRYLPWLLDLKRFPTRSITGSARLFVHNAGLVDLDDRKGTRDTIKAFMKVKRKDIKLLVRIQKETELPPFDSRVEVHFGNLGDPADLYRYGDVAIQPSKMEGIGFMVLEAVASGLPVLTLNYPPMNEFVAQPQMQANLRWFRRKANATNWIKHAHMRLPNIADLAQRIAWCAERDMAPIAMANRQWAEKQFAVTHLRSVWIAALAALL
jgi:glycosyltransferase involved in cell wall biosynthesis